MLDNLKCKLGFHKPVQEHFSVKHKYRTTNKGRSKKRYYAGVKELYTITYCKRCGKTLRHPMPAAKERITTVATQRHLSLHVPSWRNC